MQKQSSISYWSMPDDAVLSHFHSTMEGLTSEDAAARLKEQGENSINKQKKTSQLMMFVHQFNNPIVIILIIATIISAITGEWIDAGIILIIVLASAFLSYLQEFSASNALEELREKVQVKSLVLRDGKIIEVISKNLVVGDIVELSAGSLVPADGLILESLDFTVNQSILTGESLPTEKRSGVIPEDMVIKDRANCVFMGTNVQNGRAKVLIVETGENTEFGQIANQLTLRPPETDFERGIRHFGYLLTQIMLILTLAVFAINVIFKRPAIDSLLFSVALAVGITPQLLPAIISITLSKGSRIMADNGVIVRRLNAIENFGSMDVLCTDKTGTLTEGTIRIDGAVDANGQESEAVYRLAYINAALQTGMTNTLDDAIVEAKNMDISKVKKQGEIPFDFTRARLSVIVQEDSDSPPTMIVKGSLNSILGICSYVQLGDEVKAKDDTVLKDIEKLYATWSNQGTRILGIAQKNVEIKEKYVIADEQDMILMGFILLSDHPKPDVLETIVDLANNGVSLRIITGDNKLIAMHTAKAVGLDVTGVLTGDELRKLSDESLWNKIETTNIFAEVDPNQKERIILALKKNSHVVGYMGDGINDVPALHAADVSISVNNAADVAKESADLVLLENSLKVLDRGIKLGRTTFGNTLKYIQVTTSANFGNMFSMAFASLFLPFLPLLPKQILLINFLTDFPALTISNDTVDAELLKSPRSWDIKLIRNFMIIFGLISSAFDFLAFAVLLILFKASEEVFQDSWFTVSVLTELLILMVMRTQRPFFKSKPAPMLLYSSILVSIFTFALPYLPFHQLLNIDPIKPQILFSMLIIAGLYIVVTEIAKHYFYRIKSNQ
ncbi:magnesium-translocating P-type ATPase [Dehalobacterium formicoaceticum]|uniref:Magnesium-transporting ATPase, P-type 1 n=1 Tax=Dehalobacterium formicoaceticum TaxID=51515 RepID=A0ABT1Y555_9FIRM|nr:magnesium-translocating P-type ATPase [Dehalobacterium formicoaceticum]MCR6545997.1 magnesium-translocating P-type ATPase [Dehalobacterium formicoaceticum]